MNNKKSTKTHLWAEVPNQISLKSICTTQDKAPIHKNTQLEVVGKLKSHFYTSATNQLKLIFGQGCQTKSASNPSVLPQTRVKYTKTPNRRLAPTSNSHFYTTTTNQIKLIFGQGCQTKLASNPSVLPQTRVKYTKTHHAH